MTRVKGTIPPFSSRQFFVTNTVSCQSGNRKKVGMVTEKNT